MTKLCAWYGYERVGFSILNYTEEMMRLLTDMDVVARLAKALQNGEGLELSADDVVELTDYQNVQDLFYDRYDCFIDAPHRVSKA